MGSQKNMKLLILSSILISSIASFRISESEANQVLIRKRRWGRSNEEKTNDKMRKNCGKYTCEFEEWAEVAENYKADGFTSENVRTQEKMDLFENQYTECVGGVTGKGQEVINIRMDCVRNVKDLFNQWPTPKPTTEKVTTNGPTTEVTTDAPTTTTTEEITTLKPTTTTVEMTTVEKTTTSEATTTEEPTTTTQAPTTTQEATTTTKRQRQPIGMTSAWATTQARRGNRYRYRNRG